MGEPALPLIKPTKKGLPKSRSKMVLLDHDANELIFAIVGPVGSGTSEVARTLQELLENPSLPGGKYDTQILKAREEITAWAKKKKLQLPSKPVDDLDTAFALQELGDKMRESDPSAVATALAIAIRRTRAKKLNIPLGADPIIPNGARRAYILDSIRHPAEVHLLRNLYKSSFNLIGVVCEEERRRERIKKKYSNAGDKLAEEFMKRDAKGTEKHGQRVFEAFHLSDFFVDNSVERFLPGKKSNKHWKINEVLNRLIKVITHMDVCRPTVSETAMYQANGAAMRSACLSRQVGAALIDKNGNLVSTGTNEVPKAGGGVYGDGFEEGSNLKDERCAYWTQGEQYCSNTREQNEIIEDLIDKVPELKAVMDQQKRDALKLSLRNTRIGGLLEFSRAVHAEMDALVSAGRQGTSTIGSRMFVTTFPCHYCARHIVSAGIDEVQYIEPFPKSQALKLHWDSIVVESSGWKAPSDGGSAVLFHPFTGVAPRLYARAFLKDRDLKDDERGTKRIGDADWGSPWHLKRVSYVELESELANLESADGF
ncbi:MAG: deoxycytidylate deaminase-related protein [Nitrospira sp.]|nr:MAG: deoxycytidylate deaminase-related protein [Nitrospira sp.]